MIIEREDKYCVLLSKDKENGELRGKYISKVNRLVKHLFDGSEPVKEPEVVVPVIDIAEPTIEKPKKKTRNKVLKDAPRD